MNRPDGNLTGATTLNHKLVTKRVELVHDVVPGTRSFSLLVNPTSPNLTKIAIEDAQAAARSLSLEIHELNASTESDFDLVFAKLIQLRTGGLVIGTDAFFTSRLERLAALALRHGVPGVYHFREFAAAGDLLSYGGSITDAFRQTGVYTGRILKGEKPANLLGSIQFRANAMIPINPREIEWLPTRAQGPGGQNVNKVSTALHLRYDIRASSLPEAVKDRLLRSGDQRISTDGVLVIKAQRYRSQERNREDALARLQQLVDDAAVVPLPRRATKPTRGSQRRRVEAKVKHGLTKKGRRKVSTSDA